MIEIYTDGSCTVNKRGAVNIGGWAFVVVENGDEIFNSYDKMKIDNPEAMEIIAVIRALEYVIDNGIANVNIHTDSKNIVEGVKTTRFKWTNNGWRGSNGKRIKNYHLWSELDGILRRINDVKFIWVRGHSGNKFNDRADLLAKPFILDTVKNTA